MGRNEKGYLSNTGPQNSKRGFRPISRQFGIKRQALSRGAIGGKGTGILFPALQHTYEGIVYIYIYIYNRISQGRRLNT